MTNLYLEHHGIKGMKWGVRRYQNPDGSLTAAGRKKYDKRERISKGFRERGSSYQKGYDDADRWVKDLTSGRKTYQDYRKTQDQDDNAYYITSKTKAIKSAKSDREYYRDQRDADYKMADRIMSTPLNKRTFYDNYKIKDSISKGISIAATAAPIVIGGVMYKKKLISGKQFAKTFLVGSVAGTIVRFNTFDTPWDEYKKEQHNNTKG